MWDQETSKKIAKILQLMAETPNLRPHPSDSSVMVFDGGIIKTLTGVTEYEFSGGTRAIYGLGLNIGLTIRLPQGEEITIASSFVYCAGCGNHLASDVKFCNQCGLAKPQNNY